MAHGTKKAKVHASFSARIDDLKQKAQAIAEAFKSLNGPAPWHTPKTVKNTLDVPNIHTGTWERNDINQNYCQDVLTGDIQTCGTCGDLIALNLQADFMAVEERAFRTRHATYLRCAAMAHGRLHYHGGEESVFTSLKDGVQAVIDAGAEGGDTAPGGGTITQVGF